MKFNEFVVLNKKTLFIGMAIRLIFAPFTGHYYDLPIWIESGELISQGISPYTPTDHVGQTILWPLWTGFSFILASLLFQGNIFVYVFLIKLLPITADLLATYVILVILRDKIQELSGQSIKQCTAIILYNPLFILASSFWAMADSTALLFILLAYVFMEKNRIYLSSFMLSIAIAFKLYPVILLPAYLLYYTKYKQNLLLGVKYCIITICIFLMLAYLPMIFFRWNTQLLTNTLFSQTQRTFGAMAPLYIFQIITEHSKFNTFSDWIPDVLVNIFSLDIFKIFWIITIPVIMLLLLYIHYYGKSYTQNEFIGFCSMTIIFYFTWILSTSWLSEQNFVPLLGLIVIFWFYKKEKKLNYNLDRISSILLSIVVTLFIVVNVPFYMFFYLLFDFFDRLFQFANSFFEEMKNYEIFFVDLRVLLRLILLIYLIYILLRYLREIIKDLFD
jgi:Gpi18-like mannosyltransferase